MIKIIRIKLTIPTTHNHEFPPKVELDSAMFTATCFVDISLPAWDVTVKDCCPDTPSFTFNLIVTSALCCGPSVTSLSEIEPNVAQLSNPFVSITNVFAVDSEFEVVVFAGSQVNICYFGLLSFGPVSAAL